MSCRSRQRKRCVCVVFTIPARLVGMAAWQVGKSIKALRIMRGKPPSGLDQTSIVQRSCSWQGKAGCRATGTVPSMVMAMVMNMAGLRP